MEFSLDRFYQINRKAIIWIVLFGLIYLLSDFFTLIFLTFIISFFAFPAARYISERLRMNQSLSVCLVYLAICTGYLALYVLVLPNVVRQAASIRTKLPAIQEKLNEMRVHFAERYPNTAWLLSFDVESSELDEEDIRDWTSFVEELLHGSDAVPRRVQQLIPPELLQKLEHSSALTNSAPPSKGPAEPSTRSMLRNEILESINQNVIDNPEFVPYAARNTWSERLKEYPDALRLLRDPALTELSPRTLHRLNRLILEQAFPSIKKEEYQTEKRMNRWISWARQVVQQHLPEFALSVLKFFANSLLAILFSFLIVLDYGRISKEIAGLASSRLRDFFVEASQPVVKFARSVGHGFQAIVTIAFITTLLTVIALVALRISAVAFLAVITFATALIPVVGTLFQVVPLVLVALNEHGPDRALWAFAAFAIIHVLTGYVIGPIIFGRRFKMNLVAVIIILFIGHQVGGVWGMILGVPIANYLLRDVLGVPIVEEKPKAPRIPASTTIA